MTTPARPSFAGAHCRGGAGDEQKADCPHRQRAGRNGGRRGQGGRPIDGPPPRAEILRGARVARSEERVSLLRGAAWAVPLAALPGLSPAWGGGSADAWLAQSPLGPRRKSGGGDSGWGRAGRRARAARPRAAPLLWRRGCFLPPAAFGAAPRAARKGPGLTERRGGLGRGRRGDRPSGACGAVRARRLDGLTLAARRHAGQGMEKLSVGRGLGRARAASCWCWAVPMAVGLLGAGKQAARAVGSPLQAGG